MSDLTSTNEEDLLNLLKELGPDEELFLRADFQEPHLISAFYLPVGWTPYEFIEIYGQNFWDNKNFQDKYWKGSMMAIALHKDVWLNKANPSKYR